MPTGIAHNGHHVCALFDGKFLILSYTHRKYDRPEITADADFGQTDLIDFGQSDFGQTDFGPNWCFSLQAFFFKKKNRTKR